MKMGVWKVTGYHTDDGGENIFEAYFATRDEAHEVYHKGEREFGLAQGYTNIRWMLEGFYVYDKNHPHIAQMFNDVKEVMEKE